VSNIRQVNLNSQDKLINIVKVSIQELYLAWILARVHFQSMSLKRSIHKDEGGEVDFESSDGYPRNANRGPIRLVTETINKNKILEYKQERNRCNHFIFSLIRLNF